MASDLVSLADRVEAAAGPDRELDAEVAMALGFTLRLPEQPCRMPDVRRWFDPDGISVGWPEGVREFPPAYTGSEDAAAALAPQGSNTALAMQDRHSRRWRWELRLADARRVSVWAWTAALARTAASLRAIDALRSQDKGEG